MGVELSKQGELIRIGFPNKDYGYSMDRKEAVRFFYDFMALLLIDAGSRDDSEEKSIGQINFEAYVKMVGGEAYDGSKIPAWSEVSEKIRHGWEAAAEATVSVGKDGDL